MIIIMREMRSKWKGIATHQNHASLTIQIKGLSFQYTGHDVNFCFTKYNYGMGMKFQAFL